MASPSNGGIIGKSNLASFGKGVITTSTATACVTLQPGTTIVQALIVSGGGSGGGVGTGSVGGGGGGAGGALNTEINANGIVPITIGGGAAGVPGNAVGITGCNSSITACGVTTSACGGGGGGGGPPSANFTGLPGGSGGGESYMPGCGAGTGVTCQGNPGGIGHIEPTACSSSLGGGGGGAGGAGVAGTTPAGGGAGGAGSDFTPDYPGQAVCSMAGGGGGSYLRWPAPSWPTTFGGNANPVGGGGAGGRSPTNPSSNNGVAGTANRGGGGGGGYSNPGCAGNGGAGGSGLVVTKELDKASGVWSMQSQFQNKQAGTWPS